MISDSQSLEKLSKDQLIEALLRQQKQLHHKEQQIHHKDRQIDHKDRQIDHKESRIAYLEEQLRLLVTQTYGKRSERQTGDSQQRSRGTGGDRSGGAR